MTPTPATPVQCTGTESGRLLPRDITLDPRLQQRPVNETFVNAYIEQSKTGEKAPPLLVVWDGGVDEVGTYWLVDGHHRLRAAVELGLLDVEVEIHRGTFDDALMLAWGANHAHGYRRTRKQTEAAIVAALTHPVWSKLSDAELGRRLHVAHTTIGRTRKRLLNPPAPKQVRPADDPLTAQETLDLVLEFLSTLKSPKLEWTGEVVDDNGHLSLTASFPEGAR